MAELTQAAAATAVPCPTPRPAGGALQGYVPSLERRLRGAHVGTQKLLLSRVIDTLKQVRAPAVPGQEMCVFYCHVT